MNGLKLIRFLADRDGLRSAGVLVVLLSGPTHAAPSGISIADASASRPASGSASLTFTLSRSGDIGYDIVVPYATADGSAVANTDYVTASGSLIVPYQAASASLPVSLLASTASGSRSFALNLASATGVGRQPRFSGRTNFAIATELPASAIAVDINGDGLPDLVAPTKNLDGTVTVQLNTTAPGATTPTYSPAQSFTTGQNSIDVTATDLNGDGRPDLVVANNGGGNVSVLLNTTAPGASTVSFTAQRLFATGINPHASTAVDLNGDGRPDLVVANYADGTVSVLINTTAAGGTVSHFAAQQVFTAGAGANAVVSADFNGDGRADIAVANRGAGTAAVLLNTSVPGSATASFSAAQSFATAAGADGIAVLDVDGDGRADLAVANIDAASVSLLINTIAPGASNASFASARSFTTGNSPTAVSARDLNCDGRPDLLVSTYDGISVLRNLAAPGSSTPNFASQPLLRSDGAVAFSADAADLNGDGRPDLLWVNGRGSLSVRLSSTPASGGTTGFAAPLAVSTGAVPSTAASADFNGDGRPDLAITNQSSNSVSVLFNTAAAGATAASFGSPQTYTTGGQTPYSIVATDVNGDGRPDLLISNFSTSDVAVLLNMTVAGATTPSFAAAVRFPSGGVDPRSLDALAVGTADVNGDGRPDLLVVNYNSSTIGVLLNTTRAGATRPSFASAQVFTSSPAGTVPRFVTASDINLDGRPDLVVVSNSTSDASTSNVTVLLNTTAAGAPAPSFAVQQAFGISPLHPLDAFPLSVTTADVNGDGRPDLLVPDYGNNDVAVLLNTTPPSSATPSLASAQVFAVGTFPQSITVADFSGDGRPDLLVTNQASRSISLLRNRTAPGASAAAFVRTTFATGPNPHFVLSADFNGDGLPDAAVVDQQINSTGVLLNTRLKAVLENAQAIGTITPVP